jgi:hypothetical protein
VHRLILQVSASRSYLASSLPLLAGVKIFTQGDGRFGVLCCLLVLLVLVPVPAHAASPTEVDIVLVSEIYDLNGWLAMHQEVVSTPTEAMKPVQVSLPGGTGGNRWLRVDRPKFSVQIITHDGSRSAKLGIYGKILAGQAHNALIAFEHAAFEVQAGLVANELEIVYGLNGVVGLFLELHVSRP